MIKLLLRLYPASWRARYGVEFAALLRERSLAPFDVADILFGAWDANLHFRGLGTGLVGGRGFRMSTRVGAYAALWTGILWVFVLMGYSALFLAGSAIALVLALSGLSYGHDDAHTVRAWAPVVVGTAGGATTFVGALLLQMNGWNNSWAAGYPFVVLLTGVTAVYVGSMLFAAAGVRSRRMGRRIGWLLVVASALGIASMALIVLGSAIPEFALTGAITLLGIVSILLFAVGWVGVGLDALVRDITSAKQPLPTKPAI